MLGALGAVLFICAAALIFYRNSQHLLNSYRAETHSHQVLNSMQAAAQRLERIDYLTRLYLLEKDKNDLNAVQFTAVQLDSGLMQLEGTVWDNGQRMRAANAHLCTQQLIEQIASLVVLLNSTPADRTSLTRKVLECRDIIGRMQVEEAVLLNQRGSEERQNASRSLIAGTVFLIVSLAVVVSLFGFLVRDARRRMKTEEEIYQANERLHSMVQTLEKQARRTNSDISPSGVAVVHHSRGSAAHDGGPYSAGLARREDRPLRRHRVAPGTGDGRNIPKSGHDAQ